MEEKTLQPADKLLFVQALYDYCSRSTNSKVKSQFADQMAVTEKSFNNKMYSTVGFKGEELDLVKSLYCQVLGQEKFKEQLTIFLRNMCDADRRPLNEDVNEDLMLAHIYL